MPDEGPARPCDPQPNVPLRGPGPPVTPEPSQSLRLPLARDTKMVPPGILLSVRAIVCQGCLGKLGGSTRQVNHCATKLPGLLDSGPTCL
jgi:hypothetical protein